MYKQTYIYIHMCRGGGAETGFRKLRHVTHGCQNKELRWWGLETSADGSGWARSMTHSLSHVDVF